MLALPTPPVVQPELKRSEKSLAGMAAGVWLVKQQWLTDSDAAGRLLDPEPYELEGCDTATGSIAQGGSGLGGSLSAVQVAQAA